MFLTINCPHILSVQGGRVLKRRLTGLSLLLRCLCGIGCVVLLTGRCRSGKSLLLERTFGDRLVAHDAMRPPAHGIEFDVTWVPQRGGFAVDEAQCFTESSLAGVLGKLAAEGRGFVVCSQALAAIGPIGLLAAAAGRRVVVVRMGTSAAAQSVLRVSG